MYWGTVPQWITAVVALGALGAALYSISAQREIARKRAVIDFLVKTVMDKEALDAHKNYESGINAMKDYLQSGRTLANFAATDRYKQIRTYLDLHELLGTGINQGVYDDAVAYSFWSEELKRACRDTKDLIE